MEQRWWVFLIDGESEDGCKRRAQDAHSQRWVSDGPYPGCYGISSLDGWEEDSEGNHTGLDNPLSLSNEQIDNLVDNYGAKLEDIYLNAVECATSDSHDKPDLNNLEGILKNNPKLLSKCQFPFQVMTADYGIIWGTVWYLTPRGKEIYPDW